jgi:probable RNA-binding protein EIF1AD
MSGAGRKSQYRKAITNEYENDEVVIDVTRGEEVVKVTGSRGANVFEIERSDGKVGGLCFLPNKFKKVIWVKRNDYVVVESAEGAADEGEVDSAGGIRFIIKQILNKNHIKYLKSLDLWPSSFNEDEKRTSGKDYGMEDMPPMDDDEEDLEEEDEEAYYDARGNTITKEEHDRLSRAKAEASGET